MKNNNQINVFQARGAIVRFKMQAAQDVGVNPTSREAGSVADQMVKKNCPIQNMKFTRHNRIAMGHAQNVQYIAAVTV